MENLIKKILMCVSVVSLIGCATQNAMPLGNDMMQIDVSAAPVYGRTGAQKMAMQKAAEATLAAGYDRFMVMGTNSWNENQAAGGSYGQFSANQNFASGDGGSFFGTTRHPEATLVIKMFHNKDKGASKAVDARQVLAVK